MREIKFRAWVHCLNKMMPVKEIDFDDFMPSVMVEINSERHEQMFFGNTDYPDCELMQYTGLKDKNGKEIYEGDILLGHSVSPERNVFEFKLIGEVYYSSRGTWDCYTYILGGFNEQVEVIGNIWEDGDLLNDSE